MTCGQGGAGALAVATLLAFFFNFIPKLATLPIFCKLVIPLVAGVVVLAFAGLVLWAVGAAVMGLVKAVRSRA